MELNGIGISIGIGMGVGTGICIGFDCVHIGIRMIICIGTNQPDKQPNQPCNKNFLIN